MTQLSLSVLVSWFMAIVFSQKAFRGFTVGKPVTALVCSVRLFLQPCLLWEVVLMPQRWTTAFGLAAVGLPAQGFSCFAMSDVGGSGPKPGLPVEPSHLVGLEWQDGKVVVK